jgi:nitrosocyanin
MAMNQKTKQYIGLILMAAGLIALVFSLSPNLAHKTFGTISTARDIHLFTVEYKATINNQPVEVYRWDPGQIVVKKGETIRLHLHGFHGSEHHFSIPEFQISGTLKKGELKTVQFRAKRIGTFEIICHTHQTPHLHGPMIGYITVVSS